MHKNNLTEIISKVTALKGEKVVIETRESRGKIEKIEGKVRGIYPAFFNIEQNGKRQFSYNYVDILTNEIIVHTPDNDVIHGPNPTHKDLMIDTVEEMDTEEQTVPFSSPMMSNEEMASLFKTPLI